jgi:hypothetical protein
MREPRDRPLMKPIVTTECVIQPAPKALGIQHQRQRQRVCPRIDSDGLSCRSRAGTFLRMIGSGKHKELNMSSTKSTCRNGLKPVHKPQQIARPEQSASRGRVSRRTLRFRPRIWSPRGRETSSVRLSLSRPRGSPAPWPSRAWCSTRVRDTGRAEGPSRDSKAGLAGMAQGIHQTHQGLTSIQEVPVQSILALASMRRPVPSYFRSPQGLNLGPPLTISKPLPERTYLTSIQRLTMTSEGRWVLTSRPEPRMISPCLLSPTWVLVFWPGGARFSSHRCTTLVPQSLDHCSSSGGEGIWIGGAREGR